jgi:hypothetical protein
MKREEKCVTGKKLYATIQVAEDALIDAWTHFDYTIGNGPIAVYLCEEGNHYHLTSKGKMNTRLEQLLKEGKIQRQREANQWLDRFKHK